MSASTSEVVPSLLRAIRELDDTAITETERNDLVSELRSKLCILESPWQQMQTLVFENTGHSAALKIAHDVGLFKNWPDDQVRKDMDLEQLVDVLESPCDPALLDRVLRALSYTGSIVSPSPNKYRLNAFSKSLGQPTMSACLEYMFEVQIPALSNLPSFVKSTSYRLPSDPSNTAWSFATGNRGPFFQWLQQNPSSMANFSQVMKAYSDSQMPWTDLYPTQTLIQDIRAEDEGRALLVDVGGSRGHDLKNFMQKHNPPPRSCYLEDLPGVLEVAEVDKDVIVLQPHDFLKEEQPVKGARAYYLHSILHDWSDDQCVEILRKIKDAMDPQGRSRILIHELVKLENGSRDLASVAEFTLMAILASYERTEQQWRRLIATAGLKVTQIFSHPLSVHSIIEAELGQ